MKMKSRITVLFLLLVILPSIAAASVIYMHTRSLMEEKVHEASLLIISKENDYISSCLKNLELSVDSFVSSLNGQNLKILTSRSDDIAGRTVWESIAARHLTAAQQKALSAVYIIDSSGINASYGPDAKMAVINDPSSQKWFSSAVESKEQVLLGTVQRFYEQGVDKIVLSVAAAIDPVNGTPSVVLFDFDHTLITDYLKIQRSNSAADVTYAGHERIIINRDGIILYSPDESMITTKASEQLLTAVSEKESGFDKIIYNSDKYYLTYVNYPELGWTFMDLVPVSGAAGRLWLRSPLLMTVIAAYLAVLLVFLYVLLRQLRPINDLTAVISDYESHFSGSSVHAPLLQIKNNDSAVNSTSDIDLLINKISRIKLSQKEAELNSLQNQINPHFLYNTLESIRGAALYHGIHEIASMSKSLSLLFRYSISDRVLVSVREELQHLENYISIQNFRFENKFELQYSIPPELMDYKILKLTLQPLIENSIKHGLEMKLGKGTIKIEILSLDSNIKIIISDDGLGMPAKKLEELNRAIANDRSRYTGEGEHSGTGIGVMNVNSRIKLYFGEQYGLKFRETPVGTTVEITLPAVTEN